MCIALWALQILTKVLENASVLVVKVLNNASALDVKVLGNTAVLEGTRLLSDSGTIGGPTGGSVNSVELLDDVKMLDESAVLVTAAVVSETGLDDSREVLVLEGIG